MISTRVAYGEILKELGATNKDIVVLDADVSPSTMTSYFKEAYPERFFNVGIAEQDMIGTAAGLATCGKTVFASTFAGVTDILSMRTTCCSWYSGVLKAIIILPVTDSEGVNKS